TQAGPEPFGLGTPVGALIDELGRRGVTVRILDAGPDSEGAVTQLLADPAARDMARWAAWRRLTPAALYGISLGLGLVAAVWFAELDVRAKLLAIPALAGSFLFARTGSLVAGAACVGRRDTPGWSHRPARRRARHRLRAADRARALRRAGGQLPAGPVGRPGRDVRRRAA